MLHHPEGVAVTVSRGAGERDVDGAAAAAEEVHLAESNPRLPGRGAAFDDVGEVVV